MDSASAKLIIHNLLTCCSSSCSSCTQENSHPLHRHPHLPWTGIWCSNQGRCTELSARLHWHCTHGSPSHAICLPSNAPFRVGVCHGRTHIQEDDWPSHDPCRAGPHAVHLPDLTHSSLHLHLRVVLGDCFDVWDHHECNRPSCSSGTAQGSG